MSKMARDSLPAYMIAHVGLRKARKIGTFMVARAVVESDLGCEPSVEEYAAWWKQSPATAYREQAAFRECFPGESSPSRFLALAMAKFNRADLVALGELPYAVA